MVAIRFISRQPDGTAKAHEVHARHGQTAMQAAVGAGINGIAADCGGMLVCATCHVYVSPDWVVRLPPPGEDEQAMLELTAAPRRDSSRLCCQIPLGPDTEGLTLELPDRQY